MFESLRHHRVILVTGPHRSGTTIAAKMIAHDTGHDLVLEDDFGYSRLHEMLAFIQADYGPCVIQCPFLAHIVHDLGIDMGKCLVVFMHRFRRDIIASEEKARTKRGNKVNFQGIGATQKAWYHSQAKRHISDLKYESWEDQCVMIPHAMDLAYITLRDHELWVENRDFSIRQTAADDEPSLNIRPRKLHPAIIDGIRTLSHL